MSYEERFERHAPEELDEPSTDGDAVRDCIHLGVGMAPTPTKVDLTLPIDAEILQWFRTREVDLDETVNEVLRSYVESQRNRKAS